MCCVACITRALRVVFSNNQLTSIPDSFGNMAQLYELNLRCVVLSSSPSPRHRVTYVPCFMFSHNRLVGLPNSFGNLTQLTELRLECVVAMSRSTRTRHRWAQPQPAVVSPRFVRQSGPVDYAWLGVRLSFFPSYGAMCALGCHVQQQPAVVTARHVLQFGEFVNAGLEARTVVCRVVIPCAACIRCAALLCSAPIS